jgi:hypothetical protein
MTKQWSLSPSSIDKYIDCPRRWAFTYVSKEREPFTLPAQAGVEVHKRLEENDIRPDEIWNGYRVGRMAELLREATPEGITAREEKFLLEYEGITFNGVKDGQGSGIILDYKTTGKATNVKSKNDLITNPQRLIYVASEPDAVTCLWLYGIWDQLDEKNPVRRREIPVERARDKELFKLKVLRPATEILTIGADTDPLSLPKPKTVGTRESPCDKFRPHGCPHKDKCFPVTKQVSLQMSSKLLNTLMADEVPATPAVAAPAADAPGTEPVAGDFAIDLLLVDCIPLDGKFLSAHSLITAAAQSVAEDNGVVHARVIDYGKGNDQTAVQLAHNIQNSGKTIPVLFLDTRSAEGRAALQPLMGLARKVIRGV